MLICYFRFVALSPIKTPQWPRFKAAVPNPSAANKQLADVKMKNIFEELEPTSDAASSDASSLQSHENQRPLATSSHVLKPLMGKSVLPNTDMLWKTAVLERYWLIFYRSTFFIRICWHWCMQLFSFV